MITTTNIHLHVGDPIQVGYRPATGHTIDFGEVGEWNTVFFHDVDQLRRLRDAIDAHLVGRLDEVEA